MAAAPGDHQNPSSCSNHYYIGVDVGSGSARAGLFTSGGQLVMHCKEDIKLWKNDNHCEQSSEDIWRSVVAAIKGVCSEVSHTDCIAGIGFDATCSLVAVDTMGNPVTVSPTTEKERNVIFWQDHRAVEEANEINAMHHPVLRFVGGKISPEMQPPKLLWLKRHLREECWTKAAHFLDLADYLTYRATGSTSRSLCCLVCKWTYIGHSPGEADLVRGWNDSFWHSIGLSDLVVEGYSRIGTEVMTPGSPVGCGLTVGVAKELGLPVGLPVGTGIIDAHAGGLGMIGARCSADSSECTLTSRCAIIGGTSSCHMTTSCDPIFVSGVWGPYYSAMCPGYYLNEGGQSSSGQLIDFIIDGYHPEVLSQLNERACISGRTKYQELEEEVLKISGDQNSCFLTRDLHVYPDYHGNRSPLADPELRGMVTGLTLVHSISDLARLYLATIQSLAYSTRHILEAMQSEGHHFKELLLCGGLSKNNLYLQVQADVAGLPVLLTDCSEAVLLGSAVLAAVASGVQLQEAMATMSEVSLDTSVQPNKQPEIVKYHDNKYTVFKEICSDQIKYKKMMKDT